MANSRVFWIVTLSAMAAQPLMAQSRAPLADYPSKPIRLVVPFAPGGGASIMARIVVDKLAPVLGQNIVIDNKGGAGGVIGTDAVAKSAPDGYTVLFMSSSYTSNPYFVKAVPYDPLKDLMPVTLVGTNFGQVLAINPSLPVRSVSELIRLAKAHPEKLDYGSAGVGNIMHLAGELFNMLADVKMTHVPYKGGANAITDVIAGQIQVIFPAAHSALPFVRSGRMHALAITNDSRWTQLPDTPTLEEAGVKKYKLLGWYGLWLPSGTPPEYRDRIQAAVAKIVRDSETRQRFTEQGLNGVASSPAEFKEIIEQELALNRKLTARMGVVRE
jgi:tripartite-type tricarboxylate transporter receptor subunit TctC